MAVILLTSPGMRRLVIAFAFASCAVAEDEIARERRRRRDGFFILHLEVQYGWQVVRFRGSGVAMRSVGFSITFVLMHFDPPHRFFERFQRPPKPTT